MIHTALLFLTNELNTWLNNKAGAADDIKAVLSAVATKEGLVIPNKTLGVSLINIEEERTFKDQKFTVKNSAGTYESRNPDLYLNLYVLISANFNSDTRRDPTTDYYEGLKQLSNVIFFFQQKSVFTPFNSPSLSDSGIEKLSVELFSFNFEQMNNFWSVVGTSYLPSVLYKVRMITIQENISQAEGIVKEIVLNLESQFNG